MISRTTDPSTAPSDDQLSTDTRLSLEARGLYQILAFHWTNDPTGDCRVPHAVLASEAGVSERQLQRYLAELIAAGYITARRRGQGQAKAYSPTPPSEEHDHGSPG
jgi:hypothetical protein